MSVRSMMIAWIEGILPYKLSLFLLQRNIFFYSENLSRSLPLPSSCFFIHLVFLVSRCFHVQCVQIVHTFQEIRIQTEIKSEKQTNIEMQNCTTWVPLAFIAAEWLGQFEVSVKIKMDWMQSNHRTFWNGFNERQKQHEEPNKKERNICLNEPALHSPY